MSAIGFIFYAWTACSGFTRNDDYRRGITDTTAQLVDCQMYIQVERVDVMCSTGGSAEMIKLQCLKKFPKESK